MDILASVGVDTVFGLPGGTIAPIFDALIDHPEIRVVIHKHESAAVFAAAGYARTSGKLGVVLVTSGPGVLNALTGVATARLDGAPVLVLAGEVSRDAYGKGALQEGSAYGLNLVQATTPLAKLAMEIPEAQGAPYALRRAIDAAMSGRRGPVVVTVPLNVSKATIQVPSLSQNVGMFYELEPELVAFTARALERSARRVIFAGSGVRHGRGPELLRALAERVQCPVMTTPKAKGVFPESHPLSLGVFGMGGHTSAQDHLAQGLEVVVAVGTSLGDLATNGWSKALQPSRNLIHVDIDTTNVARAYPAQVTLACSAEMFFEEVLASVAPVAAVETHGVRRHADAARVRSERAGRVAPPRVLWELQQALPRDTIYCVDSGEHYFFATHYLEIDHPDAYLTMTGLGAMSSSLGGAIGAQLARPDRGVAVVCGDGGFAMAAAEIATAAQEGLPIVFVVFNDQRLGMVELGNMAIFGRTPDYATGPVDIAGLARALGADARVIEAEGEVLALPELRARRDRPLVLDVRIDDAIRLPKNGRFEALGAKEKK